MIIVFVNSSAPLVDGGTACMPVRAYVKIKEGGS